QGGRGRAGPFGGGVRDSALWQLVAAACESGAGVPLAALLEDGDLLATTTDYLTWRSQETKRAQRR
ncbi:MAG TPA: hypothetical protein VIK32_04595, partial [Candidatus Limnocylindrales bacterium]